MGLATAGVAIKGEAAMKDNTRLAYAAAMIGGVLLWMVTAAVSGRMEAWDAPLYWKAAYPLGIALAGFLGYWVPEKAWRWGLALMLVQGVMPVLGGAGLGLFPLALVMLGVLALPPMAAALLGSRIRRRTGATP